MQTPNDPRALSTLEWDRLHNLANCLEEAWRSSTEVDLGQYLPPEGDRLRPAALQEFIKIDLEARWRRGHGPRLETYLERFPELGTVSALPPQLIWEDFRLRQRYGDMPSWAEYQGRFPKQYQELKRMAESNTGGSLGRMGSGENVPPPSEGFVPVRRIGSGNFAEVWLAKAPGGREVAMKIHYPAKNEEATQQDIRALELTKKMGHPFLLENHQWWFWDGRLYVAMELAEGTLRDRAKQCQKQGMKGIPLDELIHYIGEAAEALDYVHGEVAQVLDNVQREAGFQHLDIKPENILLKGGHAKVADYGLARALDNARLLMTVECAGTPAYMPPEVWRGKMSRHSDQYSLAATYVNLRLNRLLFESTNLGQLMLDHSGKVPDLEPLPKAEQAVLLRALAKDPADRFPTCRAFTDALRQAVAPPPPPPPPRPNLISRLITGSLVLAALILTFALLRNGTPPPSPPNGKPTPQPVVPVYKPLGCEPHPEAVLLTPEGLGARLYDRIVCVKANQQVEFLLVLPKRATDPPPFYIMRDKVCNRLYRAFYRLDPEGAGSTWSEGALSVPPNITVPPIEPRQDGHPVFNMKVDEAYRFARWLGGKYGTLPSARQWDKAGGRFEGFKGPFPSDPAASYRSVALVLGNPAAACVLGNPATAWWFSSELQLLGIDVGLGMRGIGPLRAGEALRDYSWCGCRDMAGNGMEWTRTLAGPNPDSDNDVPFSQPVDKVGVRVRGESHLQLFPYRFRGNIDNVGVPRNEAKWDISFRVVIEVPLP